jgi:hypothetical protein
MKSNTRLLLAGSLLIGILTLLLGQTVISISPALTHDTSVYLNAAYNLAQGNGLRIDMTLTPMQESSRRYCDYMPGFPAFLSFFLWLGVPEGFVLRGVILAGMLSMVMLGIGLMWEWSHRLIPSLATGLLLLLFPPLVNYMTYALTESLYLPLTIGVILGLSLYFRTTPPSRKVLIILALLMASISLTRIVGLLLVGIVGAMMLIRSIIHREWKQAAVETTAIFLSQVPTFLVLLSNYLQTGKFYCATNSAGWEIERTTRGYLLQLLINQFKPDLSLGLGFRRAFSALPVEVIMMAGLLAFILAGIVIWKTRLQIREGFQKWVSLPVLTVLLYLAGYFGFLFLFGNSWAMWDFPRYFIPGYPFLLLLIVFFIDSLWQSWKHFLPRTLLFLAMVFLIIAYAQMTYQKLPEMITGRGIESEPIKNHPVFTYLQQNLQPSDLLLSTREPTLWYYLRRPVRRVERIENLSCAELQKPPSGGRMFFVLFPEGNYQGDPTSAENEAWFRGWIAPCGVIIEHRNFNETAVYIIDFPE